MTKNLSISKKCFSVRFKPYHLPNCYLESFDMPTTSSLASKQHLVSEFKTYDYPWHFRHFPREDLIFGSMANYTSYEQLLGTIAQKFLVTDMFDKGITFEEACKMFFNNHVITEHELYTKKPIKRMYGGKNLIADLYKEMSTIVLSIFLSQYFHHFGSLFDRAKGPRRYILLIYTNERVDQVLGSWMKEAHDSCIVKVHLGKAINGWYFMTDSEKAIAKFKMITAAYKSKSVDCEYILKSFLEQIKLRSYT
jgi:hypothetical protein